MAVTAYAAKGDEERIRDAGAEGYVSKPISVVRSSRRCGRCSTPRNAAAEEPDGGGQGPPRRKKRPTRRTGEGRDPEELDEGEEGRGSRIRPG